MLLEVDGLLRMVYRLFGSFRGTAHIGPKAGIRRTAAERSGDDSPGQRRETFRLPRRLIV